MDRIDFRSDTVTWPTPEMREAMAAAPVGDDVYGEDPTVNRLEEAAAGRVGKEAGLFVSSGTMGNLVAILTHAQRGDEAIVGRESHTFLWEGGGMSAFGGITPCPLSTDEDGRMDPAEVEASVRGDDPHLPVSRLVLVENTFGDRGGVPLEPGYFAAIRAVADRHGLAVHLDGARLFNAATALGVGADVLSRDADTVTFCLSKGLCAPLGSVLCGPRTWIDRARRLRKHLGGGMRQAGIVAAAGLIALEKMTTRLDEDHRHARLLADGLADIPAVVIDPRRVRTNIVHFELKTDCGVSSKELIRRLREDHGIGLNENRGRCLRAVTHYWVGADEVRAFVDATRRILG